MKTALSDHADEEKRDCNVLIFGLEEAAEEMLCERVRDVFQELGEKPNFDAKRLGVVKPERPTRAVKVIFRNAVSEKAVLGQATKLRETEKYREVYVSPDRTPGQRMEQRALVKKEEN